MPVLPQGVPGNDPPGVVDASFDRYSGGEFVGKKHILRSIPAALERALPDFRYMSSMAQYRRPFEGGTSYIILGVSKMVLTLEFGTNIDAVEDIRKHLFSCTQVKNSPNTIWLRTGSMGLDSTRWRQPEHAIWPITGSEGLQLAGPEIAAVVEDIVLPYLARHEHPEHVRETLLNHPGNASGAHLYRAVSFAIDVLRGRMDWLEDDFAHYRALLPSHGAEAHSTLEERYNLAKEAIRVRV
jgi:hypothetical protein